MSYALRGVIPRSLAVPLTDLPERSILRNLTSALVGGLMVKSKHLHNHGYVTLFVPGAQGGTKLFKLGDMRVGTVGAYVF